VATNQKRTLTSLLTFESASGSGAMLLSKLFDCDCEVHLPVNTADDGMGAPGNHLAVRLLLTKRYREDAARP
jgi:hypothetical protein